MIDFGHNCMQVLRAAKQSDPAMSWERVAQLIQAEFDKSLLSFAPTPRITKKQMQNDLFDALAAVVGQSTKEMSRAMARSIAVALADIRAVTPDLTVGEINRRAEAYRNKHRDWPLTATSLAKYWGEFGGARTRQAKGDPYIAPPNWEQLAKRVFPEADFSGRIWNDLSITIRSDIIKRAS